MHLFACNSGYSVSARVWWTTVCKSRSLFRLSDAVPDSNRLAAVQTCAGWRQHVDGADDNSEWAGWSLHGQALLTDRSSEQTLTDSVRLSKFNCFKVYLLCIWFILLPTICLIQFDSFGELNFLKSYFGSSVKIIVQNSRCSFLSWNQLIRPFMISVSWNLEKINISGFFDQ